MRKVPYASAVGILMYAMVCTRPDMVEVGKELIWMKNFLRDLGMKQEKFLLHCDNQSVMHLAKNAIYHSQIRHIQRRHHWSREKVEGEEFTLVKIHTNDNGSDMSTKTLPMYRLGVC